MSLFHFSGRLSRKTLDEKLVTQVKKTVTDNLAVRGIRHFRVYVGEIESIPLILIHTRPQSALRHSAAIETQLLDLVLAQTGCEIKAVFWRFKGSHKKHSVVNTQIARNIAVPPPRPTRACGSFSDTVLHDIHRLAEEGMEVKDLSITEFGNFLTHKTPPCELATNEPPTTRQPLDKISPHLLR